MFFHQDITGDCLPRGTVCFTYDDGPGSHTLELGRYLFEEQIPATFFVVGSHAETQRDVLAHLREWGHLIGNHSYSHRGLVAVAHSGDVVGELKRTDAIIRPYVSGEVVFFRPPYGDWREKVVPDGEEDKDISIVANMLNRSGEFSEYVGPIGWDIDGGDWAFWRQDLSAKECAEYYLAQIKRIGGGIILMHDSSEEEEVRRRNKTLQMTKILVPLLKERGYLFVRLDAVPQVAAAVQACRKKIE